MNTVASVSEGQPVPPGGWLGLGVLTYGYLFLAYGFVLTVP